MHIHDLSAAGVAVFRFQGQQFVLDHAQYFLRVRQQVFEIADALLQFLVFGLQLLPLQLREALERHIEDGLGLDFGQFEAFHQPGAGCVGVGAAADGGDDLVQVGEGDEQALEDVRSFLGPRQVVFRAPAHDLAAVLDEKLEHALEREQVRLAIHQGQGADAKRLPERGQLVKLLQEVLGLDIAGEFDHDPHPLPVGLIPQVGDALQTAFAHQLGDALDHPAVGRLIRQLGDDQPRAAAAHGLDMDFGLDGESAATAGIGLGDGVLSAFFAILIAEDDAAGGEIRAFDVEQQVFERDLIDGMIVVEHEGQSIHHFAQVVRGQVGGHAHGDAAGAVEQQVGQGRGHDKRLFEGVIEVGAEIDRVFVDVGQHLPGDLAQPGLGVAHGGGVVAIDRAEVALAVNQWVAHREILRQPHHGVVHSHIAVGMVLAQHLADDARAFLVGPVVAQAHVVHGIEDAAVHGFEAVAHVGQGAGHDHAHGVVEVRAAHFVIEVDGLDFAEGVEDGHGDCVVRGAWCVFRVIGVLSLGARMIAHWL